MNRHERRALLKRRAQVISSREVASEVAELPHEEVVRGIEALIRLKHVPDGWYFPREDGSFDVTREGLARLLDFPPEMIERFAVMEAKLLGSGTPTPDPFKGLPWRGR